ncbi:MAG: starvation-inducible outer membrane lipoprotein [Halioglobus sp.]|jgi:starvation-inducible outer membrane lipoprotein
MRLKTWKKLLTILLLSGLVCMTLPATQAQAKQPNAKSQSSMSPAQAAAKAKAKHGGKVLKVTPKGRGYRVKLLTDSGRVITVNIKG